MSSIDQRVVQMQFDNKQFEAGVAQTMTSLDKLNKGLKLQGATKGLSDVDSAAKGISLGSLASGIDAIAGKFTTMGAIGLETLQHITDKVVDVGIELAKSFVIDPIKDGFANYEMQIGAVQTILANTASQGTKLKDVTAALAELNKYANQTVYNFGEMTDNIGRFTADGVNLKDAVSSIKGIANLAAMSGATTQQATSGMYQLSQAIAAGVVKLQDWNSVVNAGFGGKVFQNALVDTARAAGVNIDAIIKKAGSFRNSLQKGWLSSQILVKTLSQFTGDLSLKQIEAMGFTEKQSMAIMAQAKLAVDAATKIKTFSQMTQALKEEVGTAYAAIFTTIFGNINEATDLFSAAHNTLENALTGPIYALNNLLQDWKQLGGRTILINALKDAFHELSAVMHTITGAWREIFPATTGSELVSITKGFKTFIDYFKMGGQTAQELKTTFAGVFAVLKIGVDIVVAIGKALFGLAGQAAQGSGGILKITSAIGQWLINLKDAIEKGGILNTIFGDMAKVLAVPLKLIGLLTGLIGKLFSTDGSKLTKSLGDVSNKLSPLEKLATLVAEGWDKAVAALGRFGKFLDPYIKKTGEFFKNMAKSIMTGMGSLNFKDILSTIDTGLFAGLVLLVKRVVDRFKGGGAASNPLTGFVDTIKETFKALTETMETMQKTLKAATLLEIAVAIGVLTASVLVLSKINTQGLERAGAALTVMFAQLMGSLVIFDKFVEGEGWAKMPFLMGSLILLAAAIDILVIAVKQLANMSWEQLGKGMSALTVMITELVATTKLMKPEGMTLGGIGMIAMATAIRILVKAVSELGGMSWEQLGKGLTGVAGLLASLALFSKFFEANATGILAGAGIILLAEGIKILADAMGKFVTYSWDQIGKGLATLAGALLSIGLALKLIPPSSVLSAAAVLIVATSLGMIGKALDSMGKQSWSAIAKGLTSMGVALGIIAAALALLPASSVLSAAAILIVAASLGMIASALVKMGGQSWSAVAKGLIELGVSLGLIAAAMALMTEALPGAAALLVVAAALAVLTPVMLAFGKMSWGEIAKSLLMLAGVFVVLGLAGLVLGALTPVLLALGAAVLLLGVGVMAAGAGVFLFAAGLTALSVAGAAGAAALVSIVKSMLELLPTVATELGKAVVAFAETIAAAAPAVVKAIVTVLSALIDGIMTLTPKVVNALLKLLGELLDAIDKYFPHILQAGINLILELLNGISSNLGKVITAATNVIIAFLNGISQNIPRVIQAGVNLVINFVNSIANAIRNNSKAMGEAGGNLATAIVEGMINGMMGGLDSIVNAAKSIATSALNAFKNIFIVKSPSRAMYQIGQYVMQGFYLGLTSGDAKKVDTVFQNLRNQLTNTINSNDQQIKNLQNRLQSLQHARHANRTEIAQLRQELSQLISERSKEQAALELTNKGLTKQHAALDALDKKYQDVTTRLNAANQTLANAIKTRDDYNKQITDAYNKDPQFTASTTLAQYEQGLADQIEKTKEFANVMQRLRKAGLGDGAYQEFLSEGIAALPMAQQLLDAGTSGIKQINSEYSQLDTVAKNIGKTASTDLYQAGVDAAQGLVNGLKKQQAALEKQMEILADAMVNAIKKKLGIKSPSRVFMEVGGFSAQGLADGLDEMSGIVEQSAAGVGTKAVSALSKTMSNLSAVVSQNMDMKPTITPVLDLSGVKKSASQIGSMLGTQSLSVQGAYSKAIAASNGYMSNMAATAEMTNQTQQPAPPPAPVTFVQNNTSPTALTPAEIYRQTKNQLSQARGVLVYQNGGNQP